MGRCGRVWKLCCTADPSIERYTYFLHDDGGTIITAPYFMTVVSRISRSSGGKSIFFKDTVLTGLSSSGIGSASIVSARSVYDIKISPCWVLSVKRRRLWWYFKQQITAKGLFVVETIRGSWMFTEVENEGWGYVRFIWQDIVPLHGFLETQICGDSREKIYNRFNVVVGRNENIIV